MIEIRPARPGEETRQKELWKLSFGDDDAYIDYFYTHRPAGVETLVLLEDGVIYRDNLKKAKLDLNEFLTYCRIGGWFDLNQLQTAILEHNGIVSFLPKEANRPATPADLGQTPKKTVPQTPFIMDGQLLTGNIRQTGKEESWVHRALLRQGYREEKEVLLALWDGGEKLTVFPMEPTRPGNQTETR